MGGAILVPLAPIPPMPSTASTGACSGRYSEAWQFAAWFCVEALLLGADNGGGAGVAMLTDSQVNFVEKGVEANAGMVLYNLTQGTYGPVTAVTLHAVTATGVPWNNGDLYRIVALSAQQRNAIEQNLLLAASAIHAARAAADGCNCALAAWALDYLVHLNNVIAAAFYSCTCGRPALTAMSDDTRNDYRRWADEQLALIRTGNLELCAGETGADFPSTGAAEQATTEFAAQDIVANDILRNS